MRSTLSLSLVVLQLLIILGSHEHSAGGPGNHGAHLHLDFFARFFVLGEDSPAHDHDQDAVYFPEGVSPVVPTRLHNDLIAVGNCWALGEIFPARVLLAPLSLLDSISQFDDPAFGECYSPSLNLRC